MVEMGPGKSRFGLLGRQIMALGVTTVPSGLVFPEKISTILQGYPHLGILHCSV